MYDFNVKIYIEDFGGAAGAENLMSILDYYPPWKWTLGEDEYSKFHDFENAVNSLSQKDVAPNTLPDTKDITIGWKWDFHVDGFYSKDKNITFDDIDTEMGNKAVDDAIKHLKLTLSVEAVQCQGCSE